MLNKCRSYSHTFSIFAKCVGGVESDTEQNILKVSISNLLCEFFENIGIGQIFQAQKVILFQREVS